MSLPDLRSHQKAATAKLGKEFGTYADRVFAALQRTHDMASAAGGIPASSFATTTEQLTGTDAARASTPDSIAALWEKGADVASAGTISLGEGGFFHVTGTTTITDIDFAVDKSGRMAWVEFTGTLILTHHATTLILPTGANITTVAGDTACFISEGTDAVRCVAYQRKDGTALAAGAGYTDEQVRDVIGAALVAGTGVTITVNDGADTITVATVSTGVGGIGSGAFAPLMSSTRPTVASTGFATWANQGSLTATDNALGVSFVGPSEGSNNRLRGKYQAVPSAPYTRTAMFTLSDMRTFERSICLGWYDGTKAHVGIVRQDGQVGDFTFSDLNTRVGSPSTGIPTSQIFFVRIGDNGTNITIEYSASGVDFISIVNTAKAGAYLGSGGYTNLFLGMINYAASGAFTLTDWQ